MVQINPVLHMHDDAHGTVDRPRNQPRAKQRGVPWLGVFNIVPPHGTFCSLFFFLPEKERATYVCFLCGLFGRVTCI